MIENKIEFQSSLATDLYYYVSELTKKADLYFIGFGLILCLIGVKLKYLAQNIVLWFLTASIMYRHFDSIKDYNRAIDNMARKKLSKGFLTLFPEENHILGFIILTIFATILLIAFFQVAMFFSRGLILVLLYFLLEPFCASFFGPYAPIVCIISDIVCFLFITTFEKYILFFISGVAVCFLGIYITFIPLSFNFEKLKNFRVLHNNIINLESKTLSDPIFFVILILSTLFFYIQVSFFKL